MFSVVAVAAISIIGLGYMHLPAVLFGVGHYTVRVELPAAANLYPTGNVTYRGTEVGRVTAVHLTDTGVEAVLSLQSGVDIPSDLDAQVHSATAIGEQYVALLPRNGTSAPLKDGDVVTANRTSIPPDINHLLDAANRGLQAIPHDDLNTVINESNTAFGGLGPEFSRFVKGSTALAIDARENIEAITSLIDNTKPVLDTQTDTSDAVAAWAAHLATITGELKSQDDAVAGVLDKGPAAADEVRALFDRLNPTLPTLLANLVSIGQVAVAYQNDLEQILVLLPANIGNFQGASVPDQNLKTAYRGIYLSFHLNLNLPPPCTTGFLPPAQRRDASFQDAPARPEGDLYCRIPQDAPFQVRGARNLPCETVPGKRAPTVKMCESDEQYVPLNDGNNWKGDPNATLSGQDIPQLPPGSPPRAEVAPPGAPPPPPVPAIAAARVRPGDGTLRRSRRQDVHPDRSGDQFTEGADVAEHADAAEWAVTGSVDVLTDYPEHVDDSADPEHVDGPADPERADEPADPDTGEAAKSAVSSSIPGFRLALMLGLVTLMALGGLAGWLGYASHQMRQSDNARNLFLAVGKQGAVNLTTIDYTEADADVARILDSSTGQFRDDFSKNAAAFLDVVKQAKSKTQGTVTDAGLASISGDSAQVLVAVAVNTVNAGTSEPSVRHWRMRIDVQKVGDALKVSNVGFVP